MKFYLAHPVLARQMIREAELKFEKRTGIALINPFYDAAERDDIMQIDMGKKAIFDRRLDYRRIVEADLKAIDEADGLVAYIQWSTPTIGTSMEIWHAFMQRKPIFIITEKGTNIATHPWLRYVTEKTDGAIVYSFKMLENAIKRKFK